MGWISIMRSRCHPFFFWTIQWEAFLDVRNMGMDFHFLKIARSGTIMGFIRKLEKMLFFTLELKFLAAVRLAMMLSFPRIAISKHWCPVISQTTPFG
jgi:hypothetical protein